MRGKRLRGRPFCFMGTAETGKADAGRWPPFEPREDMEKLLRLRETDADAFALRTSEATRNTLAHYENWKAGADGPPREG